MSFYTNRGTPTILYFPGTLIHTVVTLTCGLKLVKRPKNISEIDADHCDLQMESEAQTADLFHNLHFDML